jgi:endonuclease/exonuclease/phosphatase family metal-dependent hydrolase
MVTWSRIARGRIEQGLTMAGEIQVAFHEIEATVVWQRCPRMTSTRRCKRADLLATVLAVLAILCGVPASGRADDAVVRIMTQNMDEGTGFQELIAAQSPGDFVAAVTTTYQNILATKPAERAAAIAREIAREEPDIVGLQEASIVRTGAAAPATVVKSDLLQSLLDELGRLGEHYSVAAIVPGLDAEAPSTLGFHVRLTTQDAILVRQGHDGDRILVANNHAQHYLTNLVTPTAIGPITLPRGWASIDVTIDNRSFRFVSTHLDTTAAVQLAQVKELILAAGSTTLPVVFSGDFNATADTGLDPTFATYQTVINAGFTEAWPQKRAPDPGFTCCQAPNLLNTTSLLNHRIDLILLRGAFGIADIHLIGNKPADRTASGLWPSDHAGVVATLRIPGPGQQHSGN